MLLGAKPEFLIGVYEMKRTFQPSNLKRSRTHGFRARMKTVGGRPKGRASLTV